MQGGDREGRASVNVGEDESSDKALTVAREASVADRHNTTQGVTHDCRMS